MRIYPLPHSRPRVAPYPSPTLKSGSGSPHSSAAATDSSATATPIFSYPNPGASSTPAMATPPAREQPTAVVDPDASAPAWLAGADPDDPFAALQLLLGPEKDADDWTWRPSYADDPSFSTADASVYSDALDFSVAAADEDGHEIDDDDFSFLLHPCWSAPGPAQPQPVAPLDGAVGVLERLVAPPDALCARCRAEDARLLADVLDGADQYADPQLLSGPRNLAPMPAEDDDALNRPRWTPSVPWTSPIASPDLQGADEIAPSPSADISALFLSALESDVPVSSHELLPLPVADARVSFDLSSDSLYAASPSSCGAACGPGSCPCVARFIQYLLSYPAHIAAPLPAAVNEDVALHHAEARMTEYGYMQFEYAFPAAMHAS